MSLSKSFSIASPVDGTTANTLETILQDLLIGVNERVSLEHEAMDSADAGKHKAGEVSVVATGNPTVVGGLGIDTYLKGLIDTGVISLPLSVPFNGYFWEFAFTPQDIVSTEFGAGFVTETDKINLKKGLTYIFGNAIVTYTRNTFTDSYYTPFKFQTDFDIAATGFNAAYSFAGGYNTFYATAPANRNHYIDESFSNVLSQGFYSLERCTSDQSNKTVTMTFHNRSKYHTMTVLEFRGYVINIPCTNYIS